MDDRLPCDEAALRAWLINYVTSVLNLPGESVPTHQSFDSYGFDSIEVVVMAGVLEEEFGVQVDPSKVLEHPSIDSFAKRFSSEVDGSAADLPGVT